MQKLEICGPSRDEIEETVKTVSKEIFSEINARENRKDNIIIHNMDEAASDIFDSSVRKEFDMDQVCVMFYVDDGTF